MFILITGATSGIGEATARLLAKKGHKLLLTGRRKDHLLKIQADFPKEQIQIASFDLRSRAACEKFLQEQATELKKIDVLINNAGLALGTERLQAAQFDDMDAMIDTNIKALLYLTRGLLPHFIAKKSGYIINLGSVAGRWVYPGGAVYCATKFAVRAISEGLRQDLLGHNIRVSNIEPGMVNTEFSLVRMGSQEKADSVYAGMKPLTGEDIAETIDWLLARPPHVNVQELVIYPTDQAHVGMVHRS
jgi:NADP-dependent 3-hydroxy acid dehydrogenase YdfG